MFECNLDASQRKRRVFLGVVLIILAYLSYHYAVPRCCPSFARFAQVTMGLGGIFTLFEGAKGWCALKALGFEPRVSVLQTDALNHLAKPP